MAHELASRFAELDSDDLINKAASAASNAGAGADEGLQKVRCEHWAIVHCNVSAGYARNDGKHAEPGFHADLGLYYPRAIK